MEKLDKIAQASGDEMAEFGNIFQRIRATTGKVALTTEDLTAAMKEMKKGTTEAADAFKIMYDTVGKRFEREMTKVKNLFTLDFGKGIMTWVLDIADAFGGLNNAIAVFVNYAANFFAAWLSYKTTFSILTSIMPLATALITKLGGPLGEEERVGVSGGRPGGDGLFAGTYSLRGGARDLFPQAEV